MDFIVYDIILLISFVIFISIFLYIKRKNTKREGLLFLYRAKWGIRLINHIGKKYRKFLNFLGYFAIGLGYILMAGIFYFLGKIVWIYLFNRDIVRAIKVPPIMPLVPYITNIVDIPGLPPFYFIYFVVVVAIIAIPHEFFHGIFAAASKVKIKKTGFGFFPFFFPVFPLAFVEQDEKSMKKASKKKQMAILSAGTFANILTAILFFFLLLLFFSLAFTSAGVNFDSYSYSVIGIASISSINGVAVENTSYEQIFNLVNKTEQSKIKTEEETYVLTKNFLEKQKNVEEYIYLYDNAPAVNAELKGAITKINNIKIDSKEKLEEELYKYSPNDTITITMNNKGEIYEKEIVLDEHPEKQGKPWLGIGFAVQEQEGIIGKMTSLIYSVKKPNIYYESNFEAATFIYNLLWWIILISISVALINMLPVGIFDGGRFLFLTVFAITKSKDKAQKVFKFLTYFILFLVVILMVSWVFSFW